MTDHMQNGPIRRDDAARATTRQQAIRMQSSQMRAGATPAPGAVKGRPKTASGGGAPAGVAATAAPAPASAPTPGGPQRLQGGNGNGKGSGSGSGKRMTAIIVGICLLVVVAVGVGIVASMGSSGFFDDSARSGQAPYKSPEEIQAELNRQVEEGMLNISIASTIEFADGASAGKAYIENVPSNHYVMKVHMDDNDSGETLYESGGIRPGEYIEDIVLAKDLDAGVYNATATFTAYDQTTLEEVGEAAAMVTLNVKG